MTMRKKFLHIIQSYRREALLFLVLSLIFLVNAPAALYEWNSAWFSMDYSLGFDSRLLIGSFLRLFFPDYLPAQAAYSFVFFSVFILLLLLALVMGKGLKSTDGTKANIGFAILMVFYLASPGSPAYLWSTENFGRFDLFLLIFTMIAIVAGLHVKSFAARILIYTLAGLLAVCIHQAFVFVFFPLLFTLYIHDLAEDKYKLSHLLSVGFCLLLFAGTFLYFQFYSGITPDSPEALAGLLRQRTDLAINERALALEYFTPFSETITTLSFSNLSERLRYTLIALVLLSPVFILYTCLWRKILCLAAGHRFKYVMILLSQLCFLPAFITAIDWGRWLGAFITVLALQLIVLAAKKDAVILSALTCLSAEFHKHPLLFILSGIWLSMLSPFEAVFLPNAHVFYSSLYQIYQTIF